MDVVNVDVTQSVKLPDPVYNRAKKEAEERDITIGAVIDRWHEKAVAWDQRGSDVL
jgi:hypothetical protein